MRNRTCAGLMASLALLSAAAAARMADPVPPAEVQSRVRSAGDVEKHKSDTVVVLDVTDVYVRPSGIGTSRRQVVTKVLKDAGVRALAVQRFEFDPHTNRLDLHAVRVYRAGGEIVEIPLASAVQQPTPAESIYWGTQQYVVSLPRLEIGDAVETLTSMTGFNVAYLSGQERPPPAAVVVADTPGERGWEFPADGELNALGEVLRPPVPGHWHDEIHWWSSIPVIEKRYTVRISKAQPLQFEIYNGELRTSVLFDGDEKIYSFEKRDLKPFQDEPSMEPAANVAPKLLLATLPSWEEKSRWLYEVSEPTFEADEAIRAKTREIIAGLKTDEEKWAALCSWVAENIRYVGTSRGMCEGYTNHDVTETFHDRAGVCKDKAGMLVGMLRVAGYESYLVMTMARQRVDRVPADQFNHAVTCVRKPDGTLVLLDPTWMPKSRDVWSTLEPDQHVVYGLPEGVGLATSPSFPPDANTAAWTGESRIDPGGNLSGSLRFTGNGAPESALRRALAGYHPGERGRFFDVAVQRLAPQARVVRASGSDPVDFSAPVEARLEYAADAFACGSGARRVLRLPLMQTVFGDRVISDLFDKTSLKERKYGLRLRATRLVRIDETLTLPDGWRAVDPPKAVQLDGPAAGLTFELSSEPGRVKYTATLTIKRWTVPPEEYANFKEVMEKFVELTGPVLVCEVEAFDAAR